MGGQDEQDGNQKGERIADSKFEISNLKSLIPPILSTHVNSCAPTQNPLAVLFFAPCLTTFRPAKLAPRASVALSGTNRAAHISETKRLYENEKFPQADCARRGQIGRASCRERVQSAMGR